MLLRLADQAVADRLDLDPRLPAVSYSFVEFESKLPQNVASAQTGNQMTGCSARKDTKSAGGVFCFTLSHPDARALEPRLERLAQSRVWEACGHAPEQRRRVWEQQVHRHVRRDAGTCSKARNGSQSFATSPDNANLHVGAGLLGPAVASLCGKPG